LAQLREREEKMPATYTIPTLFGRATAVFGEHGSLHTLLSRLRDVSAGVGDGSVETGNERDRQRLLEELRERLSLHFAAEEDDGYFGMLVATQPALHTAVTRLAGEHQEFLLTIDRLLGFGTTSSENQQFTLLLNGFLERFNAHEQRENTLLQEFFLRDDGGEGS
jgi:hypothetical protein